MLRVEDGAHETDETLILHIIDFPGKKQGGFGKAAGVPSIPDLFIGAGFAAAAVSGRAADHQIPVSAIDILFNDRVRPARTRAEIIGLEAVAAGFLISGDFKAGRDSDVFEFFAAD